MCGAAKPLWCKRLERLYERGVLPRGAMCMAPRRNEDVTCGAEIERAPELYELELNASEK